MICSRKATETAERRLIAKQLAQGVRSVETVPVSEVSDPLAQAQKIQELLDQVTNFPGKLTPWEREFIESIRESWNEYRRLTPRQLDVLEKIAGKR
jgi:hypothetical protein